MSTTKLHTAEDLLRMPDDDWYELIEGELVEVPMAGAASSANGVRIGSTILGFVQPLGLGYVTGADGGNILETNPDTVIAPDVGFIQKSRYPDGLPRRGYSSGPPDLAVEVLSPTDEPNHIRRKQGLYEQVKVPIVWWVDPRTQTVTVRQPGAEAVTLRPGDVLDGGQSCRDSGCQWLTYLRVFQHELEHLGATVISGLRGIDQVAVVVRDLDASMRHYSEKIGIGPWNVYTYGPHRMHRMTYRGEQRPYVMKLALAFSGPTMYELIQSVDGPNVYEEFLAEHGEGLHHLGYYVDDIHAEITNMQNLGFDLLQSGEGFGLHGDGAYAYFDTVNSLGCIIEAIEQPKEMPPPEWVFAAP